MAAIKLKAGDKVRLYRREHNHLPPINSHGIVMDGDDAEGTGLVWVDFGELGFGAVALSSLSHAG